MKPVSEAAQCPPTPEEMAEAAEILAFIMGMPKDRRARFLAYFLREAEETGAQKMRESLGPR